MASRRIKALVSSVAGKTKPAKRYPKNVMYCFLGIKGQLTPCLCRQGLREKLKGLTPVDYERYVLVHANSVREGSGLT